MPLSLTAQMLADVREQSMEECMEWAEALIEAQLGTDGMAFGDHSLDRGERIARFIDYAQRGILDILGGFNGQSGISRPTFDLLTKAFIDDMTASPLLNTPPVTKPYVAAYSNGAVQ